MATVSETVANRSRASTLAGSGMLRLVFATLCLLLLAWTLGQQRDQTNPNRQARATPGPDARLEIRLRANPAHQYVVSGRINGVPVTFLVDTGAADVALALALAQDLGLPLAPGGLTHTGNGVVRTWTSHLDAVDVGGLVVRGLPVTVLPNLPGDQVLLGMSYLRHFELWARQGEMILRVPGADRAVCDSLPQSALNMSGG